MHVSFLGHRRGRRNHRFLAAGSNKVDLVHMEQELGRARQIHKGGALDDSFVSRTHGVVLRAGDDDLAG